MQTCKGVASLAGPTNQDQLAMQVDQPLSRAGTHTRLAGDTLECMYIHYGKNSFRGTGERRNRLRLGSTGFRMLRTLPRCN